MSFIFHSGAELLKIVEKNPKLTLPQICLRREIELTHKDAAEIKKVLSARLETMEASIKKGLKTKNCQTMGGLGGGDAKKLEKFFTKQKKSLLGETANLAATYAIANNENNACMGCIVACPTAGSSGTLPAVLFALRETQKISGKKMLDALVVSSAIGAIIAENATVSGAEGGCQAEIGSAAAMAAAGAVQILGGNPTEVVHAATLALKNMLGLVCDPIGGMVEVPCIKRNAFAAVHALTASQLALAGIESVIPFDEVVDSLKRIGNMMPAGLRETALGGLATTKTGREINRRLGIEIKEGE